MLPYGRPVVTAAVRTAFKLLVAAMRESVLHFNSVLKHEGPQYDPSLLSTQVLALHSSLKNKRPCAAEGGEGAAAVTCAVHAGLGAAS